MKKRTLYFVYEIALNVIILLISLISKFSNKTRNFHRNRFYKKEDQNYILSARNKKKYALIYFCSSAGEYEQALPLVNRIDKRGDTFQLIIFFSESGINYKNTFSSNIVSIKSFYDTSRNWKNFLSEFCPNACIVVRHEIWPNFLRWSNHFSKTILINGSINENKWNSRTLKSKLLSYLVSNFNIVFTTSDNQRHLFKSLLGKDSVVASDTKYDRVLDRAAPLKNSCPQNLEILKESFSYKKVFILGSGWKPDILAILKAYKRIQTNTGDNSWILVIVSHDVRNPMIEWIKEQCRSLGFKNSLYSQMDVPSTDCNVVIVDKIGVLFELYSLSHLAMVGGALDNKIHNVLEPSVFGLRVCFGPRYYNSDEACYLVERKIATVIRNESDIYKFWVESIQSGRFYDENVDGAMKEKFNGSKKIIQYLESNILR